MKAPPPVKRPPKSRSKPPGNDQANPAAPGSEPPVQNSPNQGQTAENEASPTEDQPSEGNPIGAMLRATPAWMVSTFWHLVLVVALAFYVIPAKGPDQEFVLNTAATDPIAEELEEFDEIDLEIPKDIEEMEITEVSMVSEIDPGAMAFGDLSSDIESPLDADVGVISLPTTTIDEIGSLLGKNGDGFAEVGEGLKAAATFFGAKAAARSIVFVVDNSNSMGNGKLETALIELNKAIELLQPTQKFYIIFYSDTAYPLFYPQTVKYLVPATNENKRKVGYWLESIQMCLRTDAMDAMKLARSLRPDLIYVLGDGAFTDKAAPYLIEMPIPNTKIHTLGMQVRPKDAVGFQKIATVHKGIYRDVGVTPEGKAMFKKFGSRKKNNTYGPIWGIKLKKK